MDIAISINGVLRDLFGKIKQVHQKYYDSDIKEDLNYDNIVKVLDFKDEDQLLEFLYGEAPMEIFGHAKEVENNFIRELNQLMSENKEHNFTFISDEVGRGIPATFWFLAKYGCVVKNIKFYNIREINDIWNGFDLIFTNDEPIIKLRPKDKEVYTFNKTKKLDSKHTLDSVREIINLNIFKKENA
jgi:hypothetical protein|tara:strand:- start:9776 stop:10333 length:558 start_codon:yes stop_codon:yes gene_type:complete